jgi:hypothetical protein
VAGLQGVGPPAFFTFKVVGKKSSELRLSCQNWSGLDLRRLQEWIFHTHGAQIANHEWRGTSRIKELIRKTWTIVCLQSAAHSHRQRKQLFKVARPLAVFIFKVVKLVPINKSCLRKTRCSGRPALRTLWQPSWPQLFCFNFNIVLIMTLHVLYGLPTHFLIF